MNRNNLAQLLASRVDSIHRCQAKAYFGSESTHWQTMWEHHVHEVFRLAGYLPSGSGFDTGTYVMIAESTYRELKLGFSFHHMDEDGGYDGWTSHTVTVRPCFQGFDIEVSDLDDSHPYATEDFGDYVADCILTALEQTELVTPIGFPAKEEV